MSSSPSLLDSPPRIPVGIEDVYDSPSVCPNCNFETKYEIINKMHRALCNKIRITLSLNKKQFYQYYIALDENETGDATALKSCPEVLQDDRELEFISMEFFFDFNNNGIYDDSRKFVKWSSNSAIKKCYLGEVGSHNLRTRNVIIPLALIVYLIENFCCLSDNIALCNLFEKVFDSNRKSIVCDDRPISQLLWTIVFKQNCLDSNDYQFQIPKLVIIQHSRHTPGKTF